MPNTWDPAYVMRIVFHRHFPDLNGGLSCVSKAGVVV
jgi:hypothetical protein